MRDKIQEYVAQGITTPILQLIPTARDPEGQREQSAGRHARPRPDARSKEDPHD